MKLAPAARAVDDFGTVGEMPAWRGHLIVLLLALHACARDNIHSEETFRIEERWKEYRNIVKDGFFLNDSMIVLAEYEDVNDKSNEIDQVAQEDQIYKQSHLAI